MNHFNVSITKSVIRILGCVTLAYGNLAAAGGLLIAAELLGIVEEFVDKRKEN
tara:strand:- start:433 stop:591 length:159 start_codon:yes stop_codon:yes gene_type:complete